jgi:tetratricopeptide (TPR) repeat protein
MPGTELPRASLHCALLASIVCATAPLHAQSENAFAAATAAFEAGDYQRALSFFQTARAGGLDSAALHYNLGVSQYRVGDYRQAIATFELIRSRFPELAALAEYNRGLALLALERDAEARVAFERVRREGDERLRGLATRALELVAPDLRASAPWSGYVDLGVGDDDNVALVDELSLPATLSASSPFTEIWGYLGRTLGNVPLRLGVSGYIVRYGDAPQYDQDAVRLDATFDWTRGAWRIEAGPHLGETRLDGDGFERTLGASVRAWRGLAANLALDLRFSHDDVTAPSSRFDFVEGTRDRLRMGLDWRGDAGRLRPSLELESNDRAAAGVSPERRRIALRYERSLTEDWSLDTLLAHRRSDFDDLAQPREERLREASAAARRELPRGWTLSTELRWADNDSSAAQFSYTSRRVTLAFGKGF